MQRHDGLRAWAMLQTNPHTSLPKQTARRRPSAWPNHARGASWALPAWPSGCSWAPEKRCSWALPVVCPWALLAGAPLRVGLPPFGPRCSWALHGLGLFWLFCFFHFWGVGLCLMDGRERWAGRRGQRETPARGLGSPRKKLAGLPHKAGAARGASWALPAWPSGCSWAPEKRCSWALPVVRSWALLAGAPLRVGLPLSGPRCSWAPHGLGCFVDFFFWGGGGSVLAGWEGEVGGPQRTARDPCQRSWQPPEGVDGPSPQSRGCSWGLVGPPSLAKRLLVGPRKTLLVGPPRGLPVGPPRRGTSARGPSSLWTTVLVGPPPFGPRCSWALHGLGLFWLFVFFSFWGVGLCLMDGRERWAGCRGQRETPARGLGSPRKELAGLPRKAGAARGASWALPAWPSGCSWAPEKRCSWALPVVCPWALLAGAPLRVGLPPFGPRCSWALPHGQADRSWALHGLGQICCFAFFEEGGSAPDGWEGGVGGPQGTARDPCQRSWQSPEGVDGPSPQSRGCSWGLVGPPSLAKRLLVGPRKTLLVGPPRGPPVGPPRRGTSARGPSSLWTTVLVGPPAWPSGPLVGPPQTWANLWHFFFLRSGSAPDGWEGGVGGPQEAARNPCQRSRQPSEGVGRPPPQSRGCSWGLVGPPSLAKRLLVGPRKTLLVGPPRGPPVGPPRRGTSARGPSPLWTTVLVGPPAWPSGPLVGPPQTWGFLVGLFFCFGSAPDGLGERRGQAAGDSERPLPEVSTALGRGWRASSTKPGLLVGPRGPSQLGQAAARGPPKNAARGPSPWSARGPSSQGHLCAWAFPPLDHGARGPSRMAKRTARGPSMDLDKKRKKERKKKKNK